MQIGTLAIYYGVLLIVVGLMVNFGMFYIRVRADQLAQTQTVFLGIGALLDMIVFAPFFGAAIYFRKVPELHKRPMIVATTSLLIAAVGGMWFWVFGLYISCGHPRFSLLWLTISCGVELSIRFTLQDSPFSLWSHRWYGR